MKRCCRTSLLPAAASALRSLVIVAVMSIVVLTLTVVIMQPAGNSGVEAGPPTATKTFTITPISVTITKSSTKTLQSLTTTKTVSGSSSVSSSLSRSSSVSSTASASTSLSGSQTIKKTRSTVTVTPSDGIMTQSDTTSVSVSASGSPTISRSDDTGSLTIKKTRSTITVSRSGGTDSNSYSRSSTTTKSLTYTRSLTPPPTPTRTDTKTHTRTSSSSESVSSSQSFSVSASFSRSNSISRSLSLSFSHSLSFSDSVTQSPSLSPSFSRTLSDSPSLTYSGTLTPPPTRTMTFSRTLTETKTSTDTDSPSLTFSDSVSKSETDPTLSTITAESLSRDGTHSRVITVSPSKNTQTHSPSPSVSQSPYDVSYSSSSTDTPSTSRELTRDTDSHTKSNPSDTHSHSPDTSMTLDTPTFSRNLTKSHYTPSETGSPDTSMTLDSPTHSGTDSPSISFSLSQTESPSLTFTKSLSESETVTETYSPSLTDPTDSVSKSKTLTFTFSLTVSRSQGTLTDSDTIPLTTSQLPPTTTPVPTPTRTLMTECPPFCGKGVCSNTYPFFCVCFASERLGFWSKPKAMEGTCDRCKPGFYGIDCNRQCPGGTCAICGGHGICDEGITGSGTCTCYNNTQQGFWTGTSCSGCIPAVYGEQCTKFCTCVRGKCEDGRYGAGTCDCEGTGFTGTNCELCDASVNLNCQVSLACPNNCYGHGTCSEILGKETCICQKGYGTVDCGVKCAAHPGTGALCYGHGICSDGNTGTGKCSCNSTNFVADTCETCVQGFHGPQCDQPCPGGSVTPCSGHGNCSGVTGLCTCEPGYGDALCSTACPTTVFGAVCSGHGSCASASGTCNCFTDATSGFWTGSACETCTSVYSGSTCTVPCPVWPLGSGSVCTGFGSCDRFTSSCVNCTSNHCGRLCEVVRSGDGVCRSCPNPGEYGPACNNTCQCVNGECIDGQPGDGSCVCNTGWAGRYCNDTCFGGAVTPCSGHGKCDPATAKCVCDAGWATQFCNASCEGVNRDCSGHGTCSQGYNGDGKCTCDAGWVFAESGCDQVCSCINGGKCIYPSLNCSCAGNFTGLSCERCVDGLAGPGCNLTCGGITNGTDCVCREGFGGPSCDDPCPTSDLGICSGARGRCDAVTATCICSAGSFGPSCRCQHAECPQRQRCDAVTGQCICEPLRKTLADDCEACIDGRWGTSCDEQCNCNGRGGCDQLTGAQCTCFEKAQTGYWSGSTCDVCLSGFMGSSCQQKSIAVTTLSPAFVNMPSVLTNMWSRFEDRNNLYYAGGAGSLIFVFNLSAGLPTVHYIASNSWPCGTWAGGDVQNMWPHPLLKWHWLYVVQGNNSCTNQVRLQISNSNHTVYKDRQTTVGRLINDEYMRISTLIPEKFTLCYVPERQTTTDSFSLGCRLINDNVSIPLSLPVAYDPVTAVVWVPTRNQILVTGASGAACGFAFSTTDKVGLTEWEGKLQTTLVDQVPRTDCRVIDAAIYVPKYNVVLFGAMAIQGVFLSGVSFKLGATQPVLKAEIVHPSQQLRSTAMIFHEKTDVGLSAFGNMLIKFRVEPVVGHDNFTIIPYGQQLMGNSLTVVRTFDLFEAQRVVLAPMRSFAGVQVMRFLLVEVTAVHPPLAESRGGTTVTVTGNSFSPNATNPVCRFGSVAAVPANVINETAITCVVPPSESAEECETNAVEVSLNNFSFTANKVLIGRPNEPLVVAASPPRVRVGESPVVTVSGRGFKESPVLQCKFFFSEVTVNASDVIIVAAKFITPTIVHCYVGKTTVITAAGSGIQISLDGQLFSTTYAPFSVLGPVRGIRCSPSELQNGSLPLTYFSTPIVVQTFDQRNNLLGDLDSNARTATVNATGEVATLLFPKLIAFPMRNGSATITGMFMLQPPVKRLPARIFVDDKWACTFSFAVSAGILQKLRIKVPPLNPGDLLLPTALLPQTTEVELVDHGGNVVANLNDIILNITLLQMNMSLNGDGAPFVQNVTKDLGTVLARDTGVASFAPQILPIVFGSHYLLRFAVVDAKTSIAVDTVIFTPGCPRNMFQVFGESQCRKCPFTEATCNGSNVLVAKNGYWRTDPDSLQFYRCPIEAACLNASEFVGCAGGYTGVLCNDCDVGFGKDFAGKCKQCGNIGGDVSTLLIAIIGIFLFLGLLTLMYVQNCTADWTVSGRIATTLQLMMTMLQTLSLFSFVNIAWPSLLIKMLSGLETFLDFRIFNFLSADCFFRRLGIDTSAIFLFYAALVCFAVGIPLIVRPLAKRFPNILMTPDAVQARKDYLASAQAQVQYAAVETFKKGENPITYLKQHQPKSIFLNALQVVFFFGIQPALRSAFEVLPCITVISDNGFEKEVMANDVRVSCDSGQYITFKILALVLVVTYAIVVPFGYTLGAAYYRFRYFDTFYKTYMGFSACGMTDELWYWIPTILLRKIWLVIIVSFLEPPINLYFFVWSMMAFAWFAYSRRPYRNKKHIFLENICNLNVILTGNIAMTVYVLGDPENVTSKILEVIALIVNFLVFGALVTDIVRNLLHKSIFRKKMKNLSDMQTEDWDEDAEIELQKARMAGDFDDAAGDYKDNDRRELENEFGELDDALVGLAASSPQNGDGSHNNSGSGPLEGGRSVTFTPRTTRRGGGGGGGGDRSMADDIDAHDEQHEEELQQMAADATSRELIDEFSLESLTLPSHTSAAAATAAAVAAAVAGGGRGGGGGGGRSADMSSTGSATRNTNIYKSWYEPTAPPQKQSGALGAMDDFFGGNEFEQEGTMAAIRPESSSSSSYRNSTAAASSPQSDLMLSAAHGQHQQQTNTSTAGPDPDLISDEELLAAIADSATSLKAEREKMKQLFEKRKAAKKKGTFDGDDATDSHKTSDKKNTGMALAGDVSWLAVTDDNDTGFYASGAPILRSPSGAATPGSDNNNGNITGQKPSAEAEENGSGGEEGGGVGEAPKPSKPKPKKTGGPPPDSQTLTLNNLDASAFAF